MANIQSPPKKKGTKGTPPPETNASVNLTKTSGDYVPLNFKVPAEFKREFKTTAASHDMSMVDMLQTCFQFWKENKFNEISN